MTQTADKCAEFARSTSDYKQLKRTLEYLEQQREQALEDLEILTNAKDDALKRPTEFVEELVNQKLPKFPRLQRVANVPFIDFDKYLHTSWTKEAKQEDDSKREYGDGKSKPKTRETPSEESSEVTSELSSEKVGYANEPQSPGKVVKPEPQDNETQEDENGHTNGKEKEPNVGEVIRGRVFTEGKPKTFNQLWTPEEQKRLEELLIEYPDEPVSSQRWAKIAKALGNRTPKQVASRTQKYFIKLAKEGLTVPGKPPNLEVYKNIKSRVKSTSSTASMKQKKKKALRSHHSDKRTSKDTDAAYYTPPPVYMSDEEDEEELVIPGLDPSLKDTEQYKELQELMKLELSEKKQAKEKVVDKASRKKTEFTAVAHHGFSCDGCGDEPIVGIRYHCNDCTEEEVDLCEACKEKGKFANETHAISHTFREIREAEEVYLDNDRSDGTNYLDPAFMSH